MSIDHLPTTANAPRRGGMTIKLVTVLALTAGGAFAVMNSGPAPVLPEATSNDSDPAQDLHTLANSEVVLGLRLRVVAPSRTVSDTQLPCEEVEFKILREEGKGSITIIGPNGEKKKFVVDPDTDGKANYSIASLVMKDGNLELVCNEVDYVGTASCVIPADKLAQLLAGMKHQKEEVEEHTFTYRPVVMGFVQTELTKQLQIRKIPESVNTVVAR